MAVALVVTEVTAAGDADGVMAASPETAPEAGSTASVATVRRMAALRIGCIGLRFSRLRVGNVIW
jgi:hypothetical protein